MQITDILNQTGGLQSIARELGISESEAASGAAALAPAILGGFQNQAENQAGGVEGLDGLLGQLGGGGLMDDVVQPQPTDVAPGNQLLGHIFGSKDVSRTVAQNASHPDRAPAVDPQEDAPHAHHAARGLHGPAGGSARRRGRRSRRWAGQHPGWDARRRRAGRPRRRAGRTRRRRHRRAGRPLGGNNPLNDILGMGRQ